MQAPGVNKLCTVRRRWYRRERGGERSRAGVSVREQEDPLPAVPTRTPYPRFFSHLARPLDDWLSKVRQLAFVRDGAQIVVGPELVWGVVLLGRCQFDTLVEPVGCRNNRRRLQLNFLNVCVARRLPFHRLSGPQTPQVPVRKRDDVYVW